MKKFTYALGACMIVIAVLVIAIIGTETAVVAGLALVLSGIAFLICGAIIERQDRLVAAVRAMDFDPVAPWARRFGPRLAVDAALVTGDTHPDKAWFAEDSKLKVEPDDHAGYYIHGIISLRYPEYGCEREFHAHLQFDPSNYRDIEAWGISNVRIHDIG